MASIGNSKTHSTLCKAEPYGAGVPIVKQECVGHGQKRMGKQCRDLLKNKFEVEVIDIATTKRARRKYAQELRVVIRGKAAGSSRGRGRASASRPVEPLTPEEAVPPVMYQDSSLIFKITTEATTKKEECGERIIYFKILNNYCPQQFRLEGYGNYN